MTTAIRAKGLYKVFGRRPGEAVRRMRDGAGRDEVLRFGTPAVIDASFDVQRGEIFVVMGLSGSGKSTLLRMLNGLLDATAGSIEVDGQDIAAMAPPQLRTVRQEKVSMVFQHFALFPHRTVAENAAYALEVRGVPKQQRLDQAQEALALTGLDGWGDALPQQLSGGMKQRVGLARALAAGTDILLMDEAFSALDPLIRREMQDQLLELQDRLGKTIVFITHDLNEAMRLGDRIAVMRDGRIVQIGTAEQILNDPANDYVAQFVQDVDRTRVLTAASVMEPAQSVVPAGAGPRAALRTMRTLQTSAAFVVSRDRRLQGVVRDADAVAALQRGDDRVVARPDDELALVPPTASLAELFAPSAENALPVAVVDDDGRLLGVVPRVTLLAAMASISAPTDSEPDQSERSELEAVSVGG